jgi:hypothetical protein
MAFLFELCIYIIYESVVQKVVWKQGKSMLIIKGGLEDQAGYLGKRCESNSENKLFSQISSAIIH